MPAFTFTGIVTIHCSDVGEIELTLPEGDLEVHVDGQEIYLPIATPVRVRGVVVVKNKVASPRKVEYRCIPFSRSHTTELIAPMKPSRSCGNPPENTV